MTEYGIKCSGGEKKPEGGEDDFDLFGDDDDDPEESKKQMDAMKEKLYVIFVYIIVV